MIVFLKINVISLRELILTYLMQSGQIVESTLLSLMFPDCVYRYFWLELSVLKVGLNLSLPR